MADPLDPKALEKALSPAGTTADWLRVAAVWMNDPDMKDPARKIIEEAADAFDDLAAAPQPAAGDGLPAYEPQVIRYDEGGFYEFVTADVSTVIRDMDGYSLVLDLETRKPIGVRWPVQAAGDGWMPIETAPKDGTHILAILHRRAIHDMDNVWRKAFSEVREIWYRPYEQFGMYLPWHAGDPFDSHDGMAPDHMGEDVPTRWRPLPAPPSEGGA